MTEERSEAMDEARAAAEEASPTDRVLDGLVERIGGRTGVRAVFGEPIERGGVTVIPVARVRWFFGAGSGSGPVAGAEAAGTGSGSGGGGGAGTVPVGYIEIGPSGATFRQIMEAYPSPLFLLAAGVTAALVLRGLARILRG
jgi:uncharacterized spore protein YtfJ